MEEKGITLWKFAILNMDLNSIIFVILWYFRLLIIVSYFSVFTPRHCQQRQARQIYASVSTEYIANNNPTKDVHDKNHKNNNVSYI